MENLDDYLDGKLSPENMEKTTQRLIRGKLTADKKQEWETILRENYNVQRNSTTKQATIRRLPVWLMAAAAVTLLLISIPVLDLFSPTSPQLALVEQQLKTPYPNNETRKGANDLEELEAMAVTAYNSADYAKSIRAYEQIVDQGKANDDILFFLGLSHLYQKNGDAGKAIEYLQLVQKDENSKYDQEISWFLSLSLLKNGETEKAKKELNQIVANQTWKNKDAKKVLNALK